MFKISQLFKIFNEGFHIDVVSYKYRVLKELNFTFI